MGGKTGVLVVDDSAFMRKVIREILAETDDFVVVDVARNGEDCLAKLKEYGDAVDLVTLDIQMPKMDGLECLTHIMSEHPRRVVMVSSLTTEGARETIAALEGGAIDFVAKPGGAISMDFKTVGPHMLSTLRSARQSRIPSPSKHKITIATHTTKSVKAVGTGTRRLIAVASSTGGPKALAMLIPSLPKDLSAAMIVVQHMPATFTKLLAERLDRASKIKVKEAEEGDQLLGGLCLIAPGGHHMEITKYERVHLADDPPVVGLRPCADTTFATVDKVFGSRTVGVVLTGMGHDGTKGCGLLKQKGCTILAESADTALIYGMPKSVVDQGLANRQVPIEGMAQAIVDVLDRM